MGLAWQWWHVHGGAYMGRFCGWIPRGARLLVCLCLCGLLLLLPPLTWLRVCSIFQQRIWTAVWGGRYFSIWEEAADLPTAQT